MCVPEADSKMNGWLRAVKIFSTKRLVGASIALLLTKMNSVFGKCPCFFALLKKAFPPTISTISFTQACLAKGAGRGQEIFNSA